MQSDDRRETRDSLVTRRKIAHAVKPWLHRCSEIPAAKRQKSEQKKEEKKEKKSTRTNSVVSPISVMVCLRASLRAITAPKFWILTGRSEDGCRTVTLMISKGG
jgi:hypothetical protein